MSVSGSPDRASDSMPATPDASRLDCAQPTRNPCERASSQNSGVEANTSSLQTRVGAALRRIARPEPFELKGLAIHYESHRVAVDGREVSLTATEYELLRVLSLNAGRVVTYETLERRVWSDRAAGDANLVRNFVKKLRAKIGEDAVNPTWIFNVRGVGYRMARPDGD